MSNETSLDEPKVFHDPIHGSIELHPLMVKIIDTPQFQRLRYIKQLGGKYYVFPGASHNRFEHSIGVGYLAGRLVETLREKQREELKINDEDVLCVKIAGLCHDLGHGPFSHLFESFIRRVRKEDDKWKHEEASVMMFKHLIEENGLKKEMKRYGLDDRDLKFIEELIEGKETCEGRSEDKWFLTEIVANKKTGVDVDKWDYLARDCHGLGLANNFDMMRYMAFVRVIPVEGKRQICVRDKEVHNLYEMFHARYTLYRRAYLHKTAIAVEEMLIEVLVSANDHLLIPGKGRKRVKMSEAIYDPHAYTRLTDNILSQILVGDDENLEKARHLLTRIEKRELYKSVHHIQWKDETQRADTIPEQILECRAPDSKHPKIAPQDLHAVVVTFDYGMKTKNPVDEIRFYRKNDLKNPFQYPKEEVSQMLPVTFSEKELRLYYTKPEPNKHTQEKECEAAKEYFEAWCKKQDERKRI